MPSTEDKEKRLIFSENAKRILGLENFLKPSIVLSNGYICHNK